MVRLLLFAPQSETLRLHPVEMNVFSHHSHDLPSHVYMILENQISLKDMGELWNGQRKGAFMMAAIDRRDLNNCVLYAIMY